MLFMPYNKSFIAQASSVKMAGYWPRSLFAFKKAKRELSQYPALLTSHLVNNVYIVFFVVIRNSSNKHRIEDAALI